MKSASSIMTPENEQCHDCVENKKLLNLILAEVRALRRYRTGADEADVEALLHEIHKLFGSEEWAAVWIFDQAADDDPGSKRLRAAMSQCLKGKLTIRRLSSFLSRAVGLYGGLNLESCGRSRNGQKFRIVTR